MATIDFKGFDPNHVKIANGDFIFIEHESNGDKDWCIYSEYLPAVIRLSNGDRVTELHSKNLYANNETNGFIITKVIPSKNAKITIQ